MTIQTKINQRRTFAIISHPDAGKTTLTEKILLHAHAIQKAGTVKGRKADRHATSDWMALEQERGISVTTSVMQFVYQGRTVNLLDTPGHEDFSEDTYRTLTAVDSALMVIDAVKGVEARTIKLMEVCRLRTTPILTFINKLDRDTQDPMSLLDEIERVLNIQCAPMTWPIGCGKSFKGVYHIYKDEICLFETGYGHHLHDFKVISGLDHPDAKQYLADDLDLLREEIELIQGASSQFDLELYRAGKLTPVYFGTALSNFGIQEMLDAFVAYAPSPVIRETETRAVLPTEEKLSGFVFKIQANMDPRHRDRIAFMRICSGRFSQRQKLYHVRSKKNLIIANALTFMAGARENLEEAFAGDIIGLHNHGSIQVGDTFTEGEVLKFLGIPYFAPELFKKVRLTDPLKMKALQKGLMQLSEEGAAQVFRSTVMNEMILGAVGVLQFDVVAHRLKLEYGVNCTYEAINIATMRWVECGDEKAWTDFKQKCQGNLYQDATGYLAYLAPTHVNLQLTQERHPKVHFLATREC